MTIALNKQQQINDMVEDEDTSDVHAWHNIVQDGRFH